MIIIVEGRQIETREIVGIKEAEHRVHGFIIQLTEDRKIKITEPETYEETYSEARGINDKYRALREKVYEKWQEDKNDIPVFNL